MQWRLTSPLFLFTYCFLSLISRIYAASSAGSSVLVVIEPQVDRKEYKTFFEGLESQGYKLTFRKPLDEKPLLEENTVPNFAHVIFFTPTTKKFSKDITQQSLVTLIQKGVNVLITLSSTQTPLSSLASEFALILPPPGTPLVSYFPARDAPHTIVPIPPLPSSTSPKHTHIQQILSKNITTPILFSGVPFAYNLSPLLVPILYAPPESFAAEVDAGDSPDILFDASEKGGEGFWAGGEMGVVTGFQPLEGGRVLWVGGIEVFSDKFFNEEVSKGVKSSNAQFARDVSAWTFQENMVLRIDDVSHHKVNETDTPESYTTNDELLYTMHISKFNPQKATWEPYSGLKDIQLEFTMLDPHIRTALLPVPGKAGEYSVQFRVPDRHGVFKFVVDYKRKGWTYLYSAVTVPVVPPRHDGYPRFLSAAWPYYTGAISTSVGFLVLSALWLGGDVAEKGKKGVAKTKAGKTD